MTLTWLRGGTVVFFVLFAVAVTWPGMIPGNRIFPLVLGLPFSMVWIAGWVATSCLVLLVLDRAEKGARTASAEGEGAQDDGGMTGSADARAEGGG